MSRLNFSALAKALERLDDSDDGMSGRCGNWELVLGGYDHGYEIYYRGAPIGRVNYEFREYELYDDDFIPKEQIPEFLAAIDAKRFKDVGYHEGDDDAIEDENEDQNMIDESRKQIMWAIDYRDMHTAIHGLFYGKSRRDVEKFYDRLQVIYADDDISPDEQEMFYQDLWDEFYPRIQQIEEINFRDIGKLPSGKYGIVIDDVEYRLVNNVSIDLYEESARKMKFRKIVKEETILEMEDADYGVAGEICSDLLNKIGVSDGESVLQVVANALKINPHGTEVNGDLVQDVTHDGLIYTFGSSKHYLLSEDVEWLRVEHYAKETKTPGPCIRYVYIHKKPNSDAFDMDNVQFDYYPDPETDDYVDGVQYKDCGRHMGASESTRRQNMKFKKIVKEADEGENYNGDTPKIYVGTYAKYNDGSIDGKWIDLTKYSTYEDFLEACYKLHEDEDDPEFMVQDYENFPEKWYHEGGLPTEEEFDKINEYYLMDDSQKDAYAAYVSHTDNDSIDDFQDAYQGHFDSPTDFAYDMVESLGWDGVGQENLDMYFDYDSFGRDLMYDFHIGDPDNTDSEGEPEDPDHYYDNDGYDQGEYESDTQVAEDYIENIGGVDQLGQETMQNYFDYEAYGRDLLINDFFEEDGYIFRMY